MNPNPGTQTQEFQTRKYKPEIQNKGSKPRNPKQRIQVEESKTKLSQNTPSEGHAGVIFLRFWYPEHIGTLDSSAFWNVET